MRQGYFITGTDTEIGKTYTCVQLLSLWQQEGKRVAAMKPIASGCDILPDGSLRNEDVEKLIAVTGQTDRDLMNPYRFVPPISPHIAAKRAGIYISLEKIQQHYRQLSQTADITLVEGAGGWFAPISDELKMADLAKSLQLPVILVVGMKLGSINHALLSAQAIQNSGLTLAGWVANQIVPPNDAYLDNLTTLRKEIAAPLILEIPHHP